MSFLAPLFAFGAITIGLPILFHLIQKRPRGQTEFSSLMFLSPSPPRLTRRSRLDNILLLLLRALCILLLAAAFTRPFLRATALLGMNAPSRRIVLLVDTSASMQRQDLWQQAQKEVETVLNDLQPTDQFALMTYGDGVTTVIGFEDLDQTPGPQRASVVRERFQAIRPTWQATNLGRAIVVAADTLETSQEASSQDGVLPPQIILVSDMQTGSQLSDLEAYQWPADVRVDIRSVSVDRTTNASLRILNQDDSESADEMRVRVYNAAGGTGEQFRVGWADAAGTLRGREQSVHVEAGKSRTIRVEPPGNGVTHLMLVGDDDSFDNAHYIATPKPNSRTLVYVDSATTSDRESLLYYLTRIPLTTTRDIVKVESRDPSQPIVSLDATATPLVVLGTGLPDDSANSVRRYMEVADGSWWCSNEDRISRPCAARSATCHPLRGSRLRRPRSTITPCWARSTSLILSFRRSMTHDSATLRRCVFGHTGN